MGYCECVGVCGALFWAQWGWVGMYRALFWVDGGKWGWVGHYFGWVGIGGGGWGWMHCLIMPDINTNQYQAVLFTSKENKNNMIHKIRYRFYHHRHILPQTYWLHHPLL